VSEEASTRAKLRRLPRHTHIAIVGSGFSGLGAAIRLSQAGHDDFIVLERGEDVGGTWRDNTYPGAPCDVPSHLYSYSFALNPNWTRSFSTQPEIEEYIRRVGQRAGVLDRHVFNCQMTRAAWQEEHHRWELSTNHGTMTADVLIGAFGALAEPSLPAIAGVDDFEGELFHSAQWNHAADLTGKRVAIIGTGASAIQIVPAIADDVAHIDVYQRTAPWLLPRFDRPFTKLERWAFRNVPGVTAVGSGRHLRRPRDASRRPGEESAAYEGLRTDLPRQDQNRNTRPGFAVQGDAEFPHRL
jgi:cation diffusion facilitator CzcD-associated flavoprotein CzcO